MYLRLPMIPYLSYLNHSQVNGRPGMINCEKASKKTCLVWDHPQKLHTKYPPIFPQFWPYCKPWFHNQIRRVGLVRASRATKVLLAAPLSCRSIQKRPRHRQNAKETRRDAMQGFEWEVCSEQIVPGSFLTSLPPLPSMSLYLKATNREFWSLNHINPL